MKIIKEIKVPTQLEHTVKKELYVCDVCGQEDIVAVSCCLCHRHICSGTSSECRYFDPRDFGDYPDKYCPKCYKLRFVEYDKKFLDIEHEADRKKEELWEEIKKLSLEE